MIWLDLLRKFWPYLAGLALLIGSGWYIHHAGYESGYAASEAKWQPLFAAAVRERDAANERTRKKEEASRALTEQIEKQHAETVALLNLRAADADKRIRALGLRFAATSASCGKVPAIPGSTSGASATTEIERRASEAAGRISGVGRDCEIDAATVALCGRWLTEQRAIFAKP